MEYVISALWIILELLFCLFFLASYLKIKRKPLQFIIAVAVVWVTMCMYSNIHLDGIMKQTISVALVFLLSFYLLEGGIAAHILLSFVCYLFIAVFDTIIGYGMCALMNISLNRFFEMHLFYSTVVTLGKLLQVLFGWILYRVRTVGKINKANSKWLFLIIFFPAVSASVLVSLFFSSQGNEDLSINAVIISAILAIANIALLYIIQAIEESTKKEQDLVLLKQQMELQTKNILALEKSYKVQRKVTHEFERHLSTMHSLFDKEQYETAREYLRQLQTNRALHKFAVNSQHPVIDVILNEKYQQALDSEIRMHIQVNDLSKVEMPTDALVVLLSNLLDNAIEACQRVEQRREIQCSIIYEEALYICIRNTSIPVAIVNGVIVTSKMRKIDHGFGIPAARYILDNVSAEYTFDYSDGWFQFVAEIPIQHTLIGGHA